MGCNVMPMYNYKKMSERRCRLEGIASGLTLTIIDHRKNESNLIPGSVSPEIFTYSSTLHIARLAGNLVKTSRLLPDNLHVEWSTYQVPRGHPWNSKHTHFAAYHVVLAG